MLTRREMLPILGIPALSFLPTIDAIASDKKKLNNEKALIVIPLVGGPSQGNTFDIHPNAPSAFQPFAGYVKTNVSGIELGSHFKELAKLANKFTVVNGISHNDSSHDSGQHMAMTAHMTVAGEMSPQKEPSIGSVMTHVYGTNGLTGIPTYVTLQKLRHASGAWMGIQSEPFITSEEGINNLKLNINNDRFLDRTKMVKAIEETNRLGNHPLMKGWSDLRGLAGQVVQGNAAKAFKVELEDEKVREKYGVGKSEFGKNLLLARRLVENGTKVVVVGNFGWDTHSGLVGQFNNIAVELDLYLSVLINDLIERGMYNDVMIVTTGEFGRTPQKTPEGGDNHWPNSMSSLILGGDFNHGTRVGQTTLDTGRSIAKPITHMDIFATIFKHFMIEENLTIISSDKRPFHILDHGAVSLL